MPVYIDTRGNSVLSVGVCDRCSRKFPYVDLMPDPNFPGMRVCKDDLDNFDPWRLPALQTENIALRFPRPDVNIALPASQVWTENDNAMFLEGIPPYSGAQGDLATGSSAVSGNVQHPPVPQPPAVPGNPPIVLGVLPNSGSASGNTAVVLQGLYLTGVTAINFGGHNVTSFTITNQNNISFNTPAGTVGAITITVTGPYGTGQGVNIFSYT